MPPEINIATEGLIDLSMARRLISAAGAAEGKSARHWGGKHNLLPRLRSYAHAAAHHPWLILIDLDSDAPCAPEWKANRLDFDCPANLILRLAVRQSESWLLADGDAIADFLGVPAARIPKNTDALGPDPR